MKKYLISIVVSSSLIMCLVACSKKQEEPVAVDDVIAESAPPEAPLKPVVVTTPVEEVIAAVLPEAIYPKPSIYPEEVPMPPTLAEILNENGSPEKGVFVGISAAEPDHLFNYFTTQMPGNGWFRERMTKRGNISRHTYRRENKSVELSIQPAGGDGNQTRITLVWKPIEPAETGGE